MTKCIVWNRAEDGLPDKDSYVWIRKKRFFFFYKIFFGYRGCSSWYSRGDYLRILPSDEWKYVES